MCYLLTLSIKLNHVAIAAELSRVYHTLVTLTLQLVIVSHKKQIIILQ